MTKVPPVEAVCAIGPDGKIDIDLIRRNPASCQAAAKSITGLPWPRAVQLGWRTVRVRIVAAGSPEAEEPMPEPVRPSPPPRRRAPGRHAEVEVRRSSSPLLRCNEGMLVDG